MFLKMAIRDLGIVAIALILWRLAADHSAGEGMVADFVGLILGLLVGAGGYFLHEWGHLAGAALTGSRVHPPTSLASGYLFSFDTEHNDRRQFVTMSLTGFAATFLVLFAFYTFLPDGLLASRVARGVAVLGLVLLVVIEMPLVVLSFVRPGIPPVAVFDPAPGAPGPEAGPSSSAPAAGAQGA